MKKTLLIIAVLFVSLTVIGAVARTVAVATASTTTVAPAPHALDSGWSKEFHTLDAAHLCTWKTRLAWCKTVRIYVHRYGYTGGLIYNSGQTLEIIWRYFDGTDKYCIRCLLQVRSINYQDTLDYDPTWDWDSMISEDSAWGPCTVEEHYSGSGCKDTYRQRHNRFTNYYVLNPIPLTRDETAGVRTHVWINDTGENHGLSMLTSPDCC